jgi:hypothetical protein
MDIKIDDKTRLRTDKRCFYLATTQIAGENAKEPGKEIERALGFYSTVEGALQGYKKHKMLNSQCTTWDGLMRLLKKIDERIAKIGEEVSV